MKNAAFISFFIIVICLFSCSKKSEFQENLLEKDLSVHESFGWKINFSAYGNLKYFGNKWGSSSQLFISCQNDILKADLDRQVMTNIAPGSGGIVTGITADDSRIIFAGKIKNKLGYYTYPITGPGIASPAISLRESEVTSLLISDNHMLLGTGATETTGRPCESPWDFWCGTSQGVSNWMLYHIDSGTKTRTVIGPSQSAIFIDPDRQKALLGSNFQIYEYDLQTLQKTDSFPFSNSGKLYWKNGALYSLKKEFNGDFVILNVRTGQEIDRFRPSGLFVNDSDLVWSPSGRKVYYTGACLNNDCRYAIWSFDLDTRVETRHVITNDTRSLISPFEEIEISPDESKLVFRHINGLYVKIL